MLSAKLPKKLGLALGALFIAFAMVIPPVYAATVYRETFTQDLSSGAYSGDFGFRNDVELVSLRIHASTNITETVTITFDSLSGSNYDTELVSASLTAEDDYVFRPTGTCVFKEGDRIAIAVTNANTTGTIYGTLFTKRLTR